MEELNPNAMGFSAAIISAGIMLILGILGNAGFYMGAVNAMQQWHIFFNLSIVGIIIGMVEAAFFSYAVIFILITLYNKFD